MSHYSDVVIAGFGPTGATLANLLSRFGLSVTVIESAREIFPLPRATHFDGEVMRVFQSIGLAERILPFTHVNPGMTFINLDHEVMLRWPRPGTVGPNNWHPSYRFHQPALEAVLRKGLDRFPDTKVRTGCELVAVQQSDDSVQARFVSRDTGLTEIVEGQYLIGCDGGRSTVRGMVDVPLEDLGSHEQWLVVDLIMKRDVEGLTDGTVQFCDPGRPTTYMRCVGQRRRWEFMVLPGDDVSALASPESVWRLLSPWLTPADADIERAVTYVFHGVIAHPWRKSRVLLAGDAAHQMPPFLGQGLCAGVRDAANLAWKLKWVIAGRASADLLDSYEAERSPHVRATIEHAIEVGEIIQAIDPEQARQRDFKLSQGPRQMTSLAPRLGSGLHRGEDRPAGLIFPQPILASGVPLDDAVGANFAVLGDREVIASVSAATKALWDINQVVCLPDEAKKECDELHARVVIVRPDRYILAVANSADELDHVSTYLPASRPKTQ
ncbi:3-(3-hydroxy-phenyl)propionate hydroxylase [Robbsia andropogonis]|uniref:bifunctional 3-(3-hydroxy-phenyl)propionate/3-hydroxycinnamic acid hydroxylase MhpA n=1 Tax=Robbsia andropogonis TaxID=28092 RepID=UPI0020A190DA|nr:bifunctional 3-(3-hydroxy-phenyl)propionate/3-hydroxycinnamic acid hydroxylase [Robbsia andropogonis]MCP1120212.1 bifunctional 3-(3-hydroxy-phenyl)propionate/3-hydroxycinnamic acid hydroxylase [Robbsia andropogonis]MCP1130142.1 bifunctional 3-(3-hydroxy-phenyl)propionate/3-hydroxycinnamic acid hydroxylase [Robbsia andropogonis]